MSRLRRASEEERRARDALTWSEWGQRLTPAQFAEREQVLRAHPWARDGMQTWLWEDEAGAVLASCETFRSESAWRGERGQSHAVASVFTAPERRGRGHASAMMTALVAELSADRATHAVTLYSDVGAPIYERSGFRALPAWDAELAPTAGDPSDVVDELLVGEPPRSPPWPADERFWIWPDGAQLDWHLARERFYAAALGRTRAAHHGARAGDARAWWVIDWKNERLMVLLVTGADDATLAALLEAARRTAGGVGVRQVTVWGDDATGAMLAAAPGVRRTERDGSLPMIAPVAAGLRPDDWRWRPRALWV